MPVGAWPRWEVVGSVVARVLALVLVVAALLSGGDSRAEPTVWEAAGDPARRRTAEWSRAAERLIQTRVDSVADLARLRHDTEQLRIAVGDAASGRRAEAAPRPDLAAGAERRAAARLDAILGELYSAPFIADWAGARRRFERALALGLDASAAGAVYYQLGVACAKLGDPVCELDSYSRALELAVVGEERAAVLLNRGDARMGAGDLTGAIADYRRARRLSARPDVQSLASYGLGVALERSGDLPAALVALREARTRFLPGATFTALDDPSVFFVPAFDMHYYRALDALAEARRVAADRDLGAARTALDAAIGHFEAYLREAVPAKTPWVPNARRHLAACRRDRLNLGPADP